MLVMVLLYKSAPKGILSASTMGAGDTDPAWLSWDIILNLRSPGSKATLTVKDSSSGIARGCWKVRDGQQCVKSFVYLF